MSKEWQKRIIYILMVAGLVWIYASYVPLLIDYYVQRPEVSFSWFYQLNIVNDIYGFESVLLVFVAVFLITITGDSAVSTIVMSLAAFVLTHGSYVKYLNRKELLRLDDLQLTEAAGMAAGYLKFEYSHYLLYLVGGLLLFVVASIGIEIVRHRVLFPVNQDNKKVRSLKEKMLTGVVRAMLAFLVFGAGFFYTEYFISTQMKMDMADGADLVEPDNDRYVLYRFVKNDSLDDINVENAEESYEFLLAQEETRTVEEAAVRPNVIVIMNESWWNTDNIEPGSVAFSKDPMEPYKELGKNCVTGYLTSNVYGGGTISSEAEFLTGLNTKYYVTSSTIYEKTLGRKLPSVVDYFNALDYETIAIHPYYGEFYSRDQVYNTMEFDEMIFDEDMRNQEVFTRYISDESLAKEIIDEYEEKDSDEQNKFIWSVSVANHRRTLEYHLDSVEDYDYPIEVDLQGKELSKEDQDILVNYINGIYCAGKSFGQLVDYFSAKKEPVVIVMYGDHMPNFSVETLDVLGLSKEQDASIMKIAHGSDGEDLQAEYDPNAVMTKEELAEANSIEMLQRVYSVPVVMWSNYELASKPEFAGESIYYLPQMLLESAGLPDSEMSKILKHQRSVFRANAREYVLDAAGEQLLECTEEQLETLNHSKTIIYDIMFGEGIGENVWQPIITTE